MRIAIPKERRPHETRVAASPETVKKLVNLGCEVVIEKGAGTAASFTDMAFKDAGATIAKDAETACKDAAVIFKVQKPIVGGKDDEIGKLAKGTVIISITDPYRSAKEIEAYAKADLTIFAMDFVPRITRAQSMDVLSSQSNLAGYKAVLDGAAVFNRAFPMMMTAAGKINPARVFVMGAGVAGLQAIATAKRLGAVVLATDVRPASKEQVESLGGKFVAVEDDEFKQAETAGGYAKEMSDAYKKKQATLIAETIAKVDMVITTALIPGRPAPVLVTADMVKSMKPGSVVVDLAVETGGNCELSQPGKVVIKNGVNIVGHLNMPGRLATDASDLYARNLFNFFELLFDKENKALSIDWNDEIVKGTCVTHEENIVHPALAHAKEPAKPATKTSASADAAKDADPAVETGEKEGGKA
ncbi:Re/Si-specific NAD(P)(+) transhydrogenase subunit alpha [Kiloniella laminariae]|uniref:proton-translocating NAD(P)(+) transhydrogenase n=1 Tax=Kiloniella laminariae TaxID=454162 RepID=A0ABT4LID8_9PROT|nr:Re/Si-specific NAD(P)(+) transhydrogenase subunit alpha [Kiloniella laminariae]MCZ4280859.1 Re/Si-specific NAD(P)(+) transhydrogenase subunit alpha [Kiloniella laminariae]